MDGKRKGKLAEASSATPAGHVADAYANALCGSVGGVPLGDSAGVGLVQTYPVECVYDMYAQLFTTADGTRGIAQPHAVVCPQLFGLTSQYTSPNPSASPGQQPGLAFVQMQEITNAGFGSNLLRCAWRSQTSAGADRFTAALASEASVYRVVGCAASFHSLQAKLYESGEFRVKLSSGIEQPGSDNWPGDLGPELPGIAIGGLGLCPLGPSGAGNDPLVTAAALDTGANFDAVTDVNCEAGVRDWSAVVPPNYKPHDLIPTEWFLNTIPSTPEYLAIEQFPALSIIGKGFLVTAEQLGSITWPAAGMVTRVKVGTLTVRVTIEAIAKPSSLATYVAPIRPLPEAIATKVTEGVQSLRYIDGGAGIVASGGFPNLIKKVAGTMMGVAKDTVRDAPHVLGQVAKGLMDRVIPGSGEVAHSIAKGVLSLFKRR